MDSPGLTRSAANRTGMAPLMVTALVIVLAGWIAGAVKVERRELAVASRLARLQPSGSPQLLSSEPLPELEGAECPLSPELPPQLTPASASVLLASTLQQAASASALPDASAPRQTINFSDRKPIRTIRDPYSAYSAVAVDHKNNEVVMADENLFQILVYDRTANTPANAIMTEPKRRIAGEQTHIEFQCGLYVDPQSGDIFAVNNDTVDEMVIFSRQAKGDVPPSRSLETPHGTFGITVDEGKQELYLTIQHDNAIVVYPKYATKEDPPIRLVQGDRTLLADPHGIALDTKNNLMFVSNFGATNTVKKDDGPQAGERSPNWPLETVVPGSGRFLPPSITVYRMDATGDIPPLRIIQGPKTRLNWATGLAMDSDRGELYVANDMSDEVLVFDVTAQGDVAPKRVLKGPKSLIKNPTGLYLDQQHDELWVTNYGNHTATVYQREASGDTAPRRVIRSGPIETPAPMLGNPHPVAYDSNRDEILVPN